jgi:hypothetical protein
MAIDGRLGPERRDAAPAPRPSGPPRAPWVPPRIVRHGSIRHLVRGISGMTTDSFGMPGKRKP